MTCFVEDEDLNALEGEGGRVLDVVNQPSRGCYHNVGVLSQHGLLRLEVQTSDRERYIDARELSQLLRDLIHLENNISFIQGWLIFRVLSEYNSLS